MAPALSRGSLKLPHLGDWTQDGQPSAQPQEREGVEGGVEVAVGGLVAEVGDAGPAGVAVVDGDGGQAGVGLEHGRDPAHVPAVTDREQREHADGAVLDGVQGPGPVGRADLRRGQHRRGRSCTRRPGCDRCWTGRSSVLGAEVLARGRVAAAVGRRPGC